MLDRRGHFLQIHQYRSISTNTHYQPVGIADLRAHPPPAARIVAIDIEPDHSLPGVGLQATVKVTGLGFPNDMKKFVKDGTSPVFGLWSVPDLGYLSYIVAQKLVSGEIKGNEGETFTIPSLNGGKPYTIRAGIVTVCGAATFSPRNVRHWTT